MLKQSLQSLTLLAATLAQSAVALAQLNTGAPGEVRDLDIVEKLGAPVPMDVQFITAEGKPVTLAEYFREDGKPAILMLGYFDCPVACPSMVDNINRSINPINFVVGREFRVIFASFDHTNSPEDANNMKSRAMAGYTAAPVTPAVRDGFVYLTSSENGARALADSVGFSYRYFPESGEFGHPSGVFVLTADGRVSRVMYGAGWDASQMRLALMEASEGKLVSTVKDKFLAFCYRWDPNSGTYTIAAFRVMQATGAVTVVLISGLVTAMFVYEKRKRRRAEARPPTGQHNTSRQAAAPSGSPREIPC